MTKQIASLYFLPLSARRAYHTDPYTIPAVPRDGKPFLLTVADCYQTEKDVVHNRIEKKTVLGEEIAPCLLREWCKSNPEMSDDCGPAVWIVRDSIPLFEEYRDPLTGETKSRPKLDADNKQVFRPATPEEASSMFAEDRRAAEARQAAWAEHCIAKGDVLALNPKIVEKNLIPDYCFASAKFLGQTPKWTHRMTDTSVVPCRFCKTMISSEAIVCPQCGRDLDQPTPAKPPIPPPLKAPAQARA